MLKLEKVAFLRKMLVVDSKERLISGYLDLFDVNYVKRNLTGHDFELVTEKGIIIIERKNKFDLLRSIIDGRLQEYFSESFKDSVRLLIVELGAKECLAKEVVAFFARMAVELIKTNNFIIIPSCCIVDTARFLMYLNEKIGQDVPIIPHIRKRKVSMEVAVFEFYCSLPGISRVRAKRLMKEYKRIYDFLSDLVSKNEKLIKLLGKKTFQKVYNFIYATCQS